MNVVNRFFLQLVLFPRRLYSRLGVNVVQLRAILTTKLVMDDRRPNTFQQTRRKKQVAPVSAATLGTMLMSAVLGLFFLASFSVGNDYITHLTVYFLIYTFMLASTLIVDFTAVLIDVRDNYIILPKPVNDRTVVTARLLHILIHITKLVLPMSLPAIIFLLMRTSGLGAVVFLVLIIMDTLLTLFLVNALYIIILRITTPQKFQAVISYFQIFIAIFIYGGYQVAIRAIQNFKVQGYDISNLPYVWTAPPYWFACAWQGLSYNDMPPQRILAITLSLVTPILSIWIVVRYFAPSFNRRLAQITTATSGSITGTKGKRPAARTSAYARALARVFTSPGAEKMGFLFGWKMTARSRDFKLKVYPSAGYLLVYAIIAFVNPKNFGIDTFRNNSAHAKIVLLCIIYFSSFMLITAINQLAYSEKHKAAWIYFAAPVLVPGRIITGALKAIMLKFYVPVIVLVTGPAIYLMGPLAIPQLVLGLFNQLLICSLIAYFNARYLPFSVNQSMEDKSSSFINGLFTLLIPATIGLLHYFIYNSIWVVCIIAALSITATRMVMGAIAKTSWARVQSRYDQ